MSDLNVIVVDGIETISLHNSLYRIRFYMLDAKGKPIPVVELVASSETVRAIRTALTEIKIG